jgi:hypothetical protein
MYIRYRCCLVRCLEHFGMKENFWIPRILWYVVHEYTSKARRYLAEPRALWREYLQCLCAYILNTWNWYTRDCIWIMNRKILPVMKMMMRLVSQPPVSCLAILDIFQPFVAWISCKKYSSINVLPHVKDFRFLITKVCSLNSYRKNNFFLLWEIYIHSNTLFLNSLFSDHSLVAVEIIFVWTLYV